MAIDVAIEKDMPRIFPDGSLHDIPMYYPELVRGEWAYYEVLINPSIQYPAPKVERCLIWVEDHKEYMTRWLMLLRARFRDIAITNIYIGVGGEPEMYENQISSNRFPILQVDRLGLIHVRCTRATDGKHRWLRNVQVETLNPDLICGNRLHYIKGQTIFAYIA